MKRRIEQSVSESGDAEKLSDRLISYYRSLCDGGIPSDLAEQIVLDAARREHEVSI